jgi:hypothetical protein
MEKIDSFNQLKRGTIVRMNLLTHNWLIARVLSKETNRIRLLTIKPGVPELPNIETRARGAKNLIFTVELKELIGDKLELFLLTAEETAAYML